jgi:hypothetical protein
MFNLLTAMKWARRPIYLSPILAALLIAAPASAETKKRNLWKASVAALAAATIADAHSSWNRPEANPLLKAGDGRFGGRSIAIKGAIIGSTLLVQHFVLKKNPQAERMTAFTNFTVAGVLGGVAVYNHRLKSEPRHAPGTPAPTY